MRPRGLTAAPLGWGRAVDGDGSRRGDGCQDGALGGAAGAAGAQRVNINQPLALMSHVTQQRPICIQMSARHRTARP